VKRLLDDPGLRESLGSAGRHLASTEFGWGRAAERFEQAYERALAFKSSKR
jgi:glycosyltransferase involved in cell wall biosynthesis